MLEKTLCSLAAVWISAEFVGAAVARGSKVPFVVMVSAAIAFSVLVFFVLWS
jgi:hypothetical protein